MSPNPRPRLAVVMDPIDDIKYAKDTSLAMLLAAQRRGYELLYLTQPDLYLRDGVARGRARPLQVFADPTRWFELGAAMDLPLGEVDVIGGRVTEINVTSPTGIREIDKAFGTDIAMLLIEAIDRRLAARR